LFIAFRKTTASRDKNDLTRASSKELEELAPCRIMIAWGVSECAADSFASLRSFLLDEGSRHCNRLDDLIASAEAVKLEDDTMDFGQLISGGMYQFDTIDSMLDAVETMRLLVVNPDEGLDGSSVAEKYVRRIVANFDAVSFERICTVFERLNAFLAGQDVSPPPANPDHVQNAFTRHCRALEQRDFSAAEDAIHQYFDLALVQFRDGEDDNTTNFANGAQFASLSIAAMQHFFGHRKEAVFALSEAINTAQQIGDEEFPRKAASWIARVHDDWRLLHTTKGDPFAALSLARREVVTLGLGSPPDERLKRVRRHVAYATSQRGESSEVAVTGLLILAAAWLLEGGRSVAVRLTHLALQRSDSVDEDLLVRAKTAVATLQLEQGDPGAAIEGLFDFAVDHPNSTTLHTVLVHLLLQIALARGQTRVADALSERLAALADDELAFRCRLFRIQVLILRGSYLKANREAAELAQVAANERRAEIVIEALLAQAEMHLEANSAPSSLPPLLSALSFTSSLHHEPLRVRGMGLLARVHMAFGELSDALETIRRILPTALHSASARDKGALHLVHAACMYENNEDFSFEEAMEETRLAEESFRISLHLKGEYEANVLQAKLANKHGRTEIRNDAAKRARQSAEQLERAKEASPFEVIKNLNDLFTWTSTVPYGMHLHSKASAIKDT